MKERISLALPPEKIEELKQKYGIPDEAINEIVDAVELETTPTDFPILGNTVKPDPPPSPSPLPASLASAMRGDISIAEAIILMDFLDRKDARREPRNTQPPLQPEVMKIIDEMRKEIQEQRKMFETALLSKKAEEAEERIKQLELELQREREEKRRKELLDTAVNAAVQRIDEQYGRRMDDIVNRFNQLTPTQQKSFLDEVAAELGEEIKEEFKQMISERLRPPKEPVVKTDKEGKPTIDWGNAIDRLLALGDKYLEAQKRAPPRLQVREIPTQGGGTSPLPDTPSEEEGEPTEEPAEEPRDEPQETEEAEPEPEKEEEPPEEAEPPSPPLTKISGIGPSRAKTLEEMGITDTRQLAKVSTKHLADTLKISRDAAEDIINQAKNLIDKP